MTINHYDVAYTNAKSTHYGTKAPSKGTLDAARRTLLHAVNYHGCGQLAQYQGPPSKTYSGENACDFYIIFPTIDPPGDDDKVNIGADMLFWDRASDNITTQWDGGATNTYQVATGGTQNGTTQPKGARIFETNEVAYDLNSVADGNAAYGYSKIAVNNCPLAYLSAYTVQRTTANYRADSAAASSFDQQFGLKNDAFNIGTPLVGTNDYDFAYGSIGALCQHQNAQDGATASMVSSTAPCVFQYAHPAGVYVAGTGSANYINLFGVGVVDSDTEDTTIKLRGRELVAGDKYLDLAVIGRWNASANCTIKVTTATGTATHTLSAAGAATPTLEVNDAFVPYDPTGTTSSLLAAGECKIEVACDASNAIEIQSIALFERSMGDDL